MVPEGSKGPKFSVGMPPRKINVQKYAESRAFELYSLQTIVANRLKGDYRCQNNKRRRTTAFDSQTGRRRKRQKQGTVDDKIGNVELVLEKDQIRKLPNRRVRRRYELKMNHESGFCTSGDGTKRLRTHVWHAKRFTMTKCWGYYLPLAVQGSGKGSRALLKRLKQGVLVHDASYYSAVQLEGPLDSLASVLRMVLVPFPETQTKDFDQCVSGITCGTAMLYQVGALHPQAIAPVNYMWRPPLQQNIHLELDGRKHVTSARENDNSDESIKCDVDLTESSDRMKHGASFRQLWVWIHASAFEEGFDNLKHACQKEMEMTGDIVKCFSLEGQLARLELMGSSTYQILKKILHPIRGVSENQWQLWEHVAEKDCVSQNKSSSILVNEDIFDSHAIFSLNVKDPRESSGKGTIVPMEPISAEAVSDAQVTNYKELAGRDGILEKNEDLLSSSWSKHEEHQYDNSDLWYATSRGLRPPVKENIIAKEKHHKRMAYFCLDTAESGEVNSSTEVQCSRSCPIVLMKNVKKELLTGWSVILPLSWVKAFWTPLISNGAHAIGLQEKHWVAQELGLPFFPSDFPDCKAYSCFMAAKAAALNQKAELFPPSKRPLRVPILPPWDVVHMTSDIEINTLETPDVSNGTDLSEANSLPNSVPESSRLSKLNSVNNLFDGIVARTDSMLTTFLNEIKACQLLLFPYAADGNARIVKFIKGEAKLNLTRRSSVISNRRLCFLRVHLQPFKKGLFEEGAVVCAPHLSDISLWTSGSDKNGGLQLPQSALGSYFKEECSSNRWEMQVPDDPIAREHHRWPIGFVTSASVHGSKRLVSEGFCEAVLLAHLREEQWKEMPVSKRKKEIYVLVRNLRSVAYRLALASVVLECQENDINFL